MVKTRKSKLVRSLSNKEIFSLSNSLISHSAYRELEKLDQKSMKFFHGGEVYPILMKFFFRTSEKFLKVLK